MRPEFRDGLRELLIGIGLQDSSRVIKAYQILGILLPGADITLLERAEAEMFKRFWGKGMDELSNIDMEEVRDFTYEFRELLYNMPFQLPQDLIFLGRAVGILSGMCTGLDPQINVFEHLGPFTQKLIAEEAKHDLNYWLKEAGDIGLKLVKLPIRIDGLISRLDKGELYIRDPQLSDNLRRVDRTISKAVGGIFFAAFLMAFIQSFIANQELLSWFFGIAAFIAFFWILIR
jgi:predicted unusual protein kinase regulating ubiquinone biosynthesis (AarF/ABC1/UbiB family)